MRKLDKHTDQMSIWNGEFGKEYTDRNNIKTAKDLDVFYKKTYGVTRTEINTDILGDVPKNIRILEVGCNIGTQLIVLQQMGFSCLYGIELQDYAVELARQETRKINIIQGSGFDIPFKDRFFDLVFTSGVLIHVAPKDINEILKEIYRCTKKYIWGFEYFAEQCTEVNYRGHGNLLWKNNFTRLYLDRFKDLEVEKETKYKYLASPNIDISFLLKIKS